MLTFSHTPILQGPGSAAKKRRALLRGLAGAWGDIALGGSGSHFVEKAYALAVSALVPFVCTSAGPGTGPAVCKTRGLPAEADVLLQSAVGSQGGLGMQWLRDSRCAPAGQRMAHWLFQSLPTSHPPWSATANLTSFGWHCVTYLPQEVAEKEAIAGELAAAEPRLLQTHRGPMLLQR